MMIEVRPLSPGRLSDLGRLFACDASAKSCWCMWFIISVREYHVGGAATNAAKFGDLCRNSQHPMGLVAYDGRQPVGWVAAGPRSRYARAVRTPTMKGLVRSEDDVTWLVPCFFVHPEARRTGIARQLLEGAVGLATTATAVAVEGFPTAEGQRNSTDPQVGSEALFASCGFTPVRRPSPKRVVMRLDLGR